MTIDQLLDKTKHYLNNNDQTIIKKAYSFADEIHKGEKRETGEPYIEHPLNVANYLVDNELDMPTITAALLHDTEESDPQITNAIKKEFGQEIYELVDGVTKLGKIKIKKNWFLPFKLLQDRQQRQYGFQRHVESLRKMLLAMSKDIRVILIKFADRLHNMQTLKGLRPDKRLRIAEETLEIYAPIAHRLGMGRLKGELENLSFPYVYPKEYKETLKLAGQSYNSKEKIAEKAKKQIIGILHNNSIKYHHIDGRKKHLYSLWRKLQKYDNNINKIYDIVALRIIVESIEDCYKVLGIIHKTWRPLIGRIKDYIAVPKPNGYQSLHTTVFGPDGQIIEIQIRTIQMHYGAEYGIAAHWHYSQNISSQKQNIKDLSSKKLDWLKELAKWQEKQTDENELLKGLNLDFFKDRIFVFTPQGDIHDLPAGATPVDFAYTIHTEVGNKCQGCKVNSKIAKLNHVLKNGDIVDIFIDQKSKGPKRDWLRFVVTSRARSKIKSRLIT